MCKLNMVGYFSCFYILEPPSRCTELEVYATSESSISIQWKRPNTIGRPDLYYKILYSDPHKPEEFMAAEEHLVNMSLMATYTITNLLPSLNYRLKVTVHNGVSDQDFANNHLRECIVTASTSHSSKL